MTVAVESLRVQIIRKAWKDEIFKQQLLADPKKAIKEAFDYEVAADIQVTAVAETEKHFYLVLPPSPENVANGQGEVELVW
ncbi:NHLP leader peptide family RiPP precursor [Paenibacillus pasadenensis]|uniref:NHLP leader peptide family RiPP precursor n=1 Tax=Paenibacillus TaxID=44249 RepID=UPI0005B8671D|nr:MULTISPECIES: NHLP leader peptide family RiPP precursor [Paenibacillus]QGG58421.1 NHLP leader peptide family natural product precursor [Paenibacillus sp. B01]